MSAPSMPSIPPRPARTHKDQASNNAAKDIPQIPPRPNHRVERSVSPQREAYARSPLNETTFAINHGNQSGGLYASSRNASNSSLPQRPPSVALPSIGQEGNEYANLEDPHPDSALGSPTETRNVGSDLKLHAPKPGLPTSSAKAKIATVTRTDSSQAAAAGIGKAQLDDKDPQSRPLRARVSFTQHDVGSVERVGSTGPGEDEQGIPEIGLRVPMYPNAGDVQAPSPSPYAQTPFTPGIGFHNSGQQQRSGRHHGRTRSGRESFQGPPGSYGLHGHGVPVQDRLERAWYEKHPDALVREENGEYGPGISGGRGVWALSSDDLNKLVRDTASRGSEASAVAAAHGFPDEQIGYLASEELASRVGSPRVQSASYHHKSHSNHSQSHLDSPLRKTSFPAEELDRDHLDLSSKDTSLRRVQSEDVVESEAEEDVVHVDQPSRRESRTGIYGASTEDLGQLHESTDDEAGYYSEHGYGVPILAADEVAKGETGEFMQPAVSPHHEGRGSNSYFTGAEGETLSRLVSHGSRGSSRPGSQPSSRPGSVHGGLSGLARFTSHEERDQVGTPLEDVEEYEPLFPENEKVRESKGQEKRPMTAADRLKRPDLAQHRFPSRDVWEDAPSHAHLMATVSTPDLVDDDAETVTGEEDSESSSKPQGNDVSFGIPGQMDKAKPHFKSHLREEMRHRPGMKQRFPSRDIWEDTPASLQLQTTVGSSEDEIKSPPELPGRPNKPSVPARPARTKAAGEPIEPTPAVPSRPPQRVHQVPPTDMPLPPAKKSPTRRNIPPPWTPATKTDEPSNEARSPEKGPAMPERPKPQVPSRPAKPIKRTSSEGAPLTKTTSATSGTSIGSVSEDKATPPAPKPKPAVPARPSGGKLSGLKSGFLSDLEKRIGLGPQGPKPGEKSAEEVEKEEEKEKVPLSDARKGRARGPVRRKPAVSPSSAADASKEEVPSAFSIVGPNRIWQISDDGQVDVSSADKVETRPSSSSSKAAHASTPTLATNTAGEPIHEEFEIAPGASMAAHSPDKEADENRERENLARKLKLASEVSNSSESVYQMPKTSDDPPVTGLDLDSGSPLKNDLGGPAELEDEDPAFTAAKLANATSTETPSALAETAAEETNHSPITLSGLSKPELSPSTLHTEPTAPVPSEAKENVPVDIPEAGALNSPDDLASATVGTTTTTAPAQN
ncbi:MAG: TATA-box-binding protein [Chaenotheca gracillima]|nr:MAG: TATA-box-binding protein [Chaenotheca gracillima]